MSSSISSSDIGDDAYRIFVKQFFRVFLTLSLALATFIVIIDPLDNVPFSPPLNRAVMAYNQRFSYPAVARKQEFDSAVIGNSVAHQFDPALLDPVFHSRFANLSMSGATPYEQYRMAALFFRHHPQAKTLLLGIDTRFISWCQQNASDKYTTREFPEWMYDENKWNGLLYLFNNKVLETAFEQVGYFMGIAEPNYNKNGFAEVIPKSNNPFEQAKLYIYGQATPKAKQPPLATPAFGQQQADQIEFPAHAYMNAILDAAPNDSLKIIFFAPQHWYVQPVENSAEAIALNACKQRITRIAQAHPNTYVIDFVRESAFTTDDHNFLDGIHLTKKAADQLIHMFPAALPQQAIR